jgi:hypothetical protein
VEKAKLQKLIDQDREEMNRAREDCDSDLSKAKREKEKIKQ